MFKTLRASLSPDLLTHGSLIRHIHLGVSGERFLACNWVRIKLRGRTEPKRRFFDDLQRSATFLEQKSEHLGSADSRRKPRILRTTAGRRDPQIAVCPLTIVPLSEALCRRSVDWSTFSRGKALRVEGVVTSALSLWIRSFTGEVLTLVSGPLFLDSPGRGS